MLDIGISIGSLLIIPTVTTLADALGWRNAFRCVGFASLGFVALWVFLAASSPQECWFISQVVSSKWGSRL
jgi:predicted MFS family arabinose efflux permease